ncbi:PREDICTED: proteoglycan 4 [Rhagoletis zephyria]|uniref:proteoglycan 4 n=1 Tax=Rhagoletis zephyria TaxID=28612 RepID=UPI0008117199|nr:PREDICTED: proteoglycan 4 [Rhagoletis zephyria]
MPGKIICCALVLISLAVLSVNAGCVCNEKGVDYCAKHKEPVFVRPKPRYVYPNPDLDLKPIGDTCSCNKVFVEPATMPKPCNKKPTPKYPTCNCNSPPTSNYYPPSPNYHPPASSTPKYGTDYYKPAPLPPRPPAPPAPSACGCGYSPTAPAYPLPDITYAKPKATTSNSIPADPISISLALQATKAVAVPEAKLAYGFAKQPVDSMKKITFSNVPEENLFKLKNDVITYKKPTLSASPPSEEVIETEEEEVVEAPDAPTLTYQQLGYVPEQFKNPKFRKITTAHSDDYYSNEAQAIPDKVTVDCGYRPGRVAAYIKRKQKKDTAEYY